MERCIYTIRRTDKLLGPTGSFLETGKFKEKQGLG